MHHSSLAEAQSKCPVKSKRYEDTLHAASAVTRANAGSFMIQWYAFSATVPQILCVAAEKAASETERKNIVANLYSELGLDADGTSHPELLKDLIKKATGLTPTPELVSPKTRAFLSELQRLMREGGSALNAGVMLALEAVAYNILEVLKEILTKSGNHGLVTHPYITIHEEVEAMHIDNTQENIELHRCNLADVNRGYAEMNKLWALFWDGTYTSLVKDNA